MRVPLLLLLARAAGPGRLVERGEVAASMACGAVVAIGPRGEVFRTLSVGVRGLCIFCIVDVEVDFALFGAVSTSDTKPSEPDSVCIESPSSAGAATPNVAVDSVAPSDDMARFRGIGTDPYSRTADNLSEGDYWGGIHVGR